MRSLGLQFWQHGSVVSCRVCHDRTFGRATFQAACFPPMQRTRRSSEPGLNDGIAPCVHQCAVGVLLSVREALLHRQ